MSGNLCYFEIPSKDLGKAEEFYKTVFGWKFNKEESSPNYSSFETSNPPHGGIEKMEPFNNGVVIYIQVDDVAETLRKIKDAGGNIVREKTEIPNIGYFGLLADPDGNIMGIFQNK